MLTFSAPMLGRIVLVQWRTEPCGFLCHVASTTKYAPGSNAPAWLARFRSAVWPDLATAQRQLEDAALLVGIRRDAWRAGMVTGGADP